MPDEAPVTIAVLPFIMSSLPSDPRAALALHCKSDQRLGVATPSSYGHSSVHRKARPPEHAPCQRSYRAIATARSWLFSTRAVKLAGSPSLVRAALAGAVDRSASRPVGSMPWLCSTRAMKLAGSPAPAPGSP